MQEQEALRRRVLDRVKGLWDEARRGPVVVSVFFDHRCSLTTGDITPLAEKLFERAVRQVSEPKRKRPEELEEGDVHDPLEGVLHHLRVWEHSLLSKSSWTETSAAPVPRCLPETVQAVLDKKNPSVADYRQRCDEVWLLLALEGFAHSSFFDIPPEMTENEYSCDFDRLFLLQVFEGKVWELGILDARETAKGD